MKKINNLLTASLMIIMTAMVLSSCQDTLESKTFSELTPSNFFTNEKDLQVAVAALYNPISVDWSRTYNGDPRNYLGMQELSTDEVVDGWGTAFGAAVTNFEVGPASYNGLEAWWNDDWMLIRFIGRATDAIDKIQKSPVEEEIKAKYIAEAKAIRGFLSYIVYDIYGPMNAIYDPVQLNSTDPLPRPDEATYLDQMINDLSEAIPDLEEKNNGTPRWGQFNKNAARAVLMRIYLNDRQWQAAAQVCSDIETNGGYELLTNYYDVFNLQQNNEIIYASTTSSLIVNYYPTEATMWDLKEANGGLIQQPAISGWGPGWIMPWEFYDKYSEEDQRTRTIIAEYTTLSGEVKTRNDLPGAIPLKFTDFTSPAGSGYRLDQPVFRLAEVYLSHAEALNELNGPTAEAIRYTQYVTDRAGITIPAEATVSKESFRDFLLDERGRELYLEYVRRTDLIRHDKYISGAQARGKDAKDHQVRYPIPFWIILQGEGVVEQNPGYVE